jgi:hypothetical protein
MQQLQIDSQVMMNPSSTSESFILESIVEAGRWQVYQLRMSTKIHDLLKIDSVQN